MKELISVIVPVYNVEKYIDRCINSIINQTYDKLEILLIDDGSNDQSGKKCDEWKKNDNRIKVIHKTNGGLSDARNVGIRKSTGDYLFFVDSDDYLELDIIECLYNNMLENDVEISTSGYIYETMSQKIFCFCKENFVEVPEQILKRLFTYDDIYNAIWAKLYKKYIFKEIEFPNGKICEDLAIICDLFDKAEKISHIDKCGYHYVQRQNSIMHRKYGRERLVIIEFVENIMKFVNEKYPNIKEYAEKFLIQHLLENVILCRKNGFKKEYKYLKNKLKEYMGMILRNKEIILKTKVMSIGVAYLGFTKFYK